VIRVHLPGHSKKRGSPAPAGREHPKLFDRIERFFLGEPTVFPLAWVDLDRCGPFQRAVLRAEHSIPRGRVRSYGGLARAIGCPTAARAVGRALATNPFPILIPCHRTIRKNGSLGGFGGGIPLKRALLEMEGVGFDTKGRVRPEYFLRED
jgi:methylated-DNA-[protein]-cysteine S-methyltransferase